MPKRMLEFQIQGLQCPRCVEVAQSAIKQVAGVVRATIDRDGFALATVQDFVEPQDIIEAIEQAGYSAEQT